MLMSYQFVVDSFINSVATIKDRVLSFFGWHNENDYDPVKGEFRELIKDGKIFDMYRELAGHWDDEVRERAKWWTDPATGKRIDMSNDPDFLKRVLDLVWPHRLSFGLLAATDRLITDPEVTRWERPELTDDRLNDYSLTVYKGTGSEVYQDIRPQFWWQDTFEYVLEEELRCEGVYAGETLIGYHIYKDYVGKLTPLLLPVRTLSDLGDILYVYRPVYRKTPKFVVQGTTFYTHKVYGEERRIIAPYPGGDRTGAYVFNRYMTANEEGKYDIPTMTNVRAEIPWHLTKSPEAMVGKRKELERFHGKSEYLGFFPGKRACDTHPTEEEERIVKLADDAEVDGWLRELSDTIDRTQQFARQTSQIFDATNPQPIVTVKETSDEESAEDEKKGTTTGTIFPPRTPADPVFRKGGYSDRIQDKSYVRLNAGDIDLLLSYYEALDPFTYYEKGLYLKFLEAEKSGTVDPGVVVPLEDPGEAPRFVQNYLAMFGAGIWPVPGYTTITSPFGYRRHPTLGIVHLHKGMDIGAPAGAPIVAPYDGVVEEVIPEKDSGGYGNFVLIRHEKEEEIEDADGKTQKVRYTMYTAYGHLSRIDVRPGQTVTQGDVIGRVGSTGRSTGPHLHFEVRLKIGDRVSVVNPIYFVGGKAAPGAPMEHD